MLYIPKLQSYCLERSRRSSFVSFVARRKTRVVFYRPNLADASTMVSLKNLLPPTEGVRHEQRDTAVEVDGQPLGSGTLFVAEA